MRGYDQDILASVCVFTKLILKCHDNLHGIKTVQSKIFYEVGLQRYLGNKGVREEVN